MSMENISVGHTIFSSQGGMNMDPRSHVFPQVFMKHYDQHIEY